MIDGHGVSIEFTQPVCGRGELLRNSTKIFRIRRRILPLFWGIHVVEKGGVHLGPESRLCNLAFMIVFAGSFRNQKNPMHYIIRGENLEVTPALREYAEKKIGRLEKYFDNTAEVDVTVTMRVLRGEQTVEVTIPMPTLILRAEETHQDMYAAIDLVVEKLERQIRKHKTKVNRKMRLDGSLKMLFNEENGHAAADHYEDDDIEIVRTKRFNLKPMDAQEAILQMEMLGHNFFVFRNAENEEVSVVYRRKDGRYGLIEAE